jgi:hypothetical protein
MVGGLGVQDIRNILREVLILLCAMSFWDVEAKENAEVQKQEQSIKGNNKFQIVVSLFLLSSEGKVSGLCTPDGRSVCRVLGTVSKQQCVGCKMVCGF